MIQEYLEVPVVKNSNIKEKIGIPGSLKVLGDKEPITKHEGVFRIMTPQDGDKRIVWDKRDLAQINEAKEMFDECVAKGLVPYWVGKNGRATSEVMDEFDPEAQEVIFLPIAQVCGG
jgi:hypothetical protein